VVSRLHDRHIQILEVGVEVGEADGGRVLDGAVGLAPALHRRHFCAAACSSPSPLSPLPSSLYFWPPGDAFDSFFFLGWFFSLFCAGAWRPGVSNFADAGSENEQGEASFLRSCVRGRVRLE